MNQNRARDNELQRAIDEITRKAAPANGGAMSGVGANPAPMAGAASTASTVGAAGAMGAGPKPVVPPVPPIPVAPAAPAASPAPVAPAPAAPAAMKPEAPAKPEMKSGMKPEAREKVAPVKSAPVPPSISSIVANAQPMRKPMKDGERKAEMRENGRPMEGAMNREKNRGGAETASVKEAALKELFPIMDRIEVSPEKRFELYREIMEVMKDRAVVKPAYEAAKAIKNDKARADALLYVIEQIEKLG